MYRAMEGYEDFSVRSEPLAGGDQGTRRTVQAMRQLADQGSRDLVLRAATLNALRTGGAAPHDVPRQVRAAYEFVRDRIYFLHDPAGTEWLQSPRVTLTLGSGDCDDRAILLAAMLQSFGVRSQFKTIAVDPRRPDNMSHVYLVADVDGEPIPLDPTYPQNVMGFEHPKPFRSAMELRL